MIDRETADSIWNETAAKTREHRETNDCTVKAMAIATGESYDTCRAALAKFGRKARKGCGWPVQWRALNSLGYVAYDLTNHVDGRTTITLERELRKRFPNGRFLIGVKRHRMAMRDGHMIDHAKGSRRRICTVYAVFPADHEKPAGYEFDRSRLVDVFETTDEPYVKASPIKYANGASMRLAIPTENGRAMPPKPNTKPEPEPTPAEPVSQNLRPAPVSRKVRRMTTKIRATGAEHPITSARKAYGLSTNQLGELLDMPGASLWRIERGLNVPRREVARALYEFFSGALPLGAIYDGPFWMDERPENERARVLAELAVLGQAYGDQAASAAG